MVCVRKRILSVDFSEEEWSQFSTADVTRPTIYGFIRHESLKNVVNHSSLGCKIRMSQNTGSHSERLSTELRLGTSSTLSQKACVWWEAEDMGSCPGFPEHLVFDNGPGFLYTWNY